MRRSEIRDTRGDRIFMAINYAALTLLLLTILYPLLYIVSASFSDPRMVTSGHVWLWPVSPTLEGYVAIFRNRFLVSGFANSLFYTLAGTAINVAMTILAAYPLSRSNLPGRNLLTLLFFFTTLFSGGLIPSYLVARNLGIINTRWAMLLPGALGIWNILIMRTYFQTSIPRELHEAAQLDGCDEITYLLKIVLPLSGPIIAVVALFSAVGHWNAFFNALIYLSDKNLWPLQLVLRDILIQNNIDVTMLTDAQELMRRLALRESLKYSLIVTATLPLLLAYPFVQKHFVKGVLLGSVKG